MKIWFGIALLLIGAIWTATLAQSNTPNLKIRAFYADNDLKFFVNGGFVGKHYNSISSQIIEIGSFIKNGKNVFQYTLDDDGGEVGFGFEILYNGKSIYRNDCFTNMRINSNNQCANNYSNGTLNPVHNDSLNILFENNLIKIDDQNAEVALKKINNSEWSGVGWTGTDDYKDTSKFGNIWGNIKLVFNIKEVGTTAASFTHTYADSRDPVCKGSWIRLPNEGDALVFTRIVESGNCLSVVIRLRYLPNSDLLRLEQVYTDNSFSTFGLLTRQRNPNRETPNDTVLEVNNPWVQQGNSLTLKDVRYSTQRGGSVAFALDFTNQKSTPVVMRYNLTDLVSVVDNNDKAYKVMFGSSTKCSTMTETVAPNVTVRLRCLATSEGAVFLDIADPKIKQLIITIPQLSSIENARWLVPMPR